jgi:hypothetical protein
MADWGHYILRNNYFSIAQGQFDGYSVVQVSGYNPDIDTAAAETIWCGGGVYPWSVFDSVRVLTVVSTSASDTGSVVVSGLDADFNPITEEIDCAGLTPTTGSVQFKRINSAFYKNGGSNNAGDVTVTANGNTVGLIQVGIGQTLTGVYTVPAGYTAYILSGNFSAQKGKDAQVRFYVRLFGQNFRTVHIGEVFENTYHYDFHAPVAMPEKSDLDVQGFLVEANNTRVTTNFSMILVRNNAVQ